MDSVGVRYFVDCTETICNDLNTGIQRTVRNIIHRHSILSTAYGINVVPVVSINGNFYKYDIDNDKKYFVTLLNKLFKHTRNVVDKVLFGKKLNIDPLLSKIQSNICTTDELFGSDKDISYSRITTVFHLRFIETCRKVMPYLFMVAFYFDKAFSDFKAIDIDHNDIIFYPDAFWHISTLASMQRYDAVKILLIHDIIPISNPAFCDEVHSLIFKKNLSKVLNLVDGIICISNSELHKIRSYNTDNDIKTTLLYDFNYWGADFAVKKMDHNKINLGIAEVMSGDRTFIMVGTLEPRKNHMVVIDAFDEFWLQGGTAALCIIGKPGWKCSELLERIHSHDFFGTRLFYFNDVNDQELAFCYEKCAGVIFASLAEGFGLPLVEAMWYERPVLASDIDVFREIGGEYPLFFPPDSVGSLVSQLHVCLSTSDRRKANHWISWDTSVISLFGKILYMTEAVKRKRSAL